MAEGSGEVVAVPATGPANGLNNGAGGTSAQTNNPLSRKLRKILDTRLDNDKELESINEDVQAMSNCCQDMTSRLQAAKEQTQDLIVKTTKLQAESQRLEIRAQVADAFLSKFQLTADEMSLLRGTREGPITEVFCSAKLTKGECRTLTQESCDISPVLTQAMEALQDRPVLYKYTLDEFGTARRSTVVRGFIDALTRGGPGGTPRPIEMHSHDPLRYVGDMLAWLHQATASEKEHLEALLKHVTTQGVEENIQEVVGHITEGVCRPLKVRIEQVIVAEPGAVLLYKISNLLKFYHHTISGIVGNSATTLLTTIEEMHLLSKKIFFNSLSLHASKLMDKVCLKNAILKLCELYFRVLPVNNKIHFELAYWI
ncbi:Conserved oligomeric Golgi complex subunit 6 [Camelus dromedarius]|uniref:Conserved oligomeric Golgi complex subunit 6 n=1 Tax=Camelus dromedarius TaxID=9838 RepID=A0A5N4D9I9_CAMDR|nr:Conserved oligomeric Golgi complex subunit 6 [Camelus dromedarius]